MAINIDGVQVSGNSTSSLIPILALIHSVSESASSEPLKSFTTAHPFIVGYFYGDEKPDPHKLVDGLITELQRLDPGWNKIVLAAVKIMIFEHGYRKFESY